MTIAIAEVMRRASVIDARHRREELARLKAALPADTSKRSAVRPARRSSRRAHDVGDQWAELR